MTSSKGCALAVVSALLLAGCSPVGMAMGAGATLGVAAAQEGGMRGAATDAAIRLQVTDSWFKHDFDMYRRLSMTVKEGRVLVTGAVPDPDMRVDAIRLVWQADGVKQVLNEISVEQEAPGVMASVGDTVSDTWISSNIKTRLLLDKDVDSINYSVESASGNVYLMGVARDQAELDRVIDTARNAGSVKNVVSYVRLRHENPATIAAN